MDGTVIGIVAGFVGVVGVTLEGLLEGTVMMVVSPKLLLIWVFCFRNDIIAPPGMKVKPTRNPVKRVGS